MTRAVQWLAAVEGIDLRPLHADTDPEPTVFAAAERLEHLQEPLPLQFRAVLGLIFHNVAHELAVV